MSVFEYLLAAYVLNAVWQLPLLYLLAAGLLWMARGLSPASAHLAWVACAAFALALPFSSILGLFDREIDGTAAQPLAVPAFLWQLTLLLFAVAALLRAWQMILAVKEARTLRSLTVPAPELETMSSVQWARLAGVAVRYAPAKYESRGPLLVGFQRPVILLPSWMARRPDLIEAAVGHEMAHVQRRDPLIAFLVEVALIPLAFHPFTHLLRKRLRETREMACDELAISQGVNRYVYARSLLELAERCLVETTPPYAMGVGGASSFERRVHAIVERRKGSRKAWAPALLVAAILFFPLARGGGYFYARMIAVPGPLALLDLVRPLLPPPPPPPPLPIFRRL